MLGLNQEYVTRLNFWVKLCFEIPNECMWRFMKCDSCSSTEFPEIDLGWKCITRK